VDGSLRHLRSTLFDAGTSPARTPRQSTGYDRHTRISVAVGRFSLGLINIQADDEPVSGAVTTNFAVARIKGDVLRRSSIGSISSIVLV